MKPHKSQSSLTLEFAFIHENILIQNERILGMYVIQSEETPFIWFGVLLVDRGLYKGSVVRFTIIVDDKYPNCACPRVIFDPIPFHPLVNPKTGELDTKNAFPDWNSNTHKLYQLLLFVKRVIRHAESYISTIQELLSQNTHVHPSTSETNKGLEPRIANNSQNVSIDPVPERPEDLFMEYQSTKHCIDVFVNHPDEFQQLTHEFNQKCSDQLYEKPKFYPDDNNSLLFGPWIPALHEPLRSCILADKFTTANLFASYHKDTDSVSFIPGSERV